MSEAPPTKTITFKKVAIGIAAIIGIIILVRAMDNVNQSTEQTKSDTVEQKIEQPVVKEQSFEEKAKARMEEVVKSDVDLFKGYSCEDDCKYVVYLEFNKVPTDSELDFIVRGNAATYSKFKMDQIGTSHVTVAAKFGEKVIMSCDAANGQVKECKTYEN